MKQEDAAVSRELIQLALTSSKIQTINSIYGRLEPGPDQRIRTHLAPYTETGRLRSGEDAWWQPERLTNLQNLPKKAAKIDPLFEVRNVVVPTPGYILLEGDLSQAEVWATAAQAGDDAKLKRLVEGDEHRRLAARVLGIEESAVTRPQRDNLGKPGNHKLNYGVGWQTFMEGVNKDSDWTGFVMNAALSKKVVAAWQQMNPKTVRWWDTVKREAAETGFLTNCFGRKRIFLNQNTAGNDIIAYLPQSTIADLLNTALVRLFGLEKEYGFRIVLQIHDAILVEAPLARWMRVARVMKETMLIPMEINQQSLTVPVDISMSGKNWGTMKTVNLS